MNIFTALVAGWTAVAILRANAADWPQFRGPNRDAISKETGLLKKWPAEGPKLRWQNKEAGEGWGAPSVVGDTVYLLRNQGVEEESVAAFKASDGSQLWSTKIGRAGKPNQQPKYPGARSTPTIDHGVAYALGSDGDLVAVDGAKGSIKWQKNLRTEYGGDSGTWAYAESPLVDGDTLLIAPGGTNATVVALNKNTGAEIWRCALSEGDLAAYASAIVVEFGGVKQYVHALQKGLVGIDAKSGKVLWRYGRPAKGSPAIIPTPVHKDGILYTVGALVGVGAVQLKKDGDKIIAEEIYYDTKLPNAIGGSVLLGDTLYGTSAAGLQAVDFKTGKVKWSDKSVGAASALYADGLLILHSEEGNVALVEASPEGYREKGRFAPKEIDRPKDAKTWAYPALANGRLYLHEGKSLLCYDVK